MDIASPPKRMTRARAARVAPAQPKILSKPSVTVASRTSAKRKAPPAEDTEDELQADIDSSSTMNKVPRPRGRVPKKAMEPEPNAEPKAVATTATKPVTARTRTTRKAAATTTLEPAEPEPVKTTRSTRVRTKLAASAEPEVAAPGSTPKKATTTRKRAVSATKQPEPGTIITKEPLTNPTPGLKSNFSRPAERSGAVATKKTVSFEEPEKENMVPAPVAAAKVTKPKTNKAAETTSATMRARPLRGTVTARSTRASARTTSTGKKPLSPKKDGANRPLSRCDDSSDDELAGGDKPAHKPLMKSPVKPPASLRRPEQKVQQGKDEYSLAPSEPTLSASAMGSPARRPPASPFKDLMKSPAKKMEVSSLNLGAQSASTIDAPQSPSKAPMLQSPAKRPQMPIKTFQVSSGEPSLTQKSPLKRSLFGSPAKRGAGTPFKSIVRDVSVTKEEKVDLPVEETSMEEEVVVKEILEEINVQQDISYEEMKVSQVDDADNSLLDHIALGQQFEMEVTEQLTFSGRLSAVLPRYADPALKEKPAKIEETVAHEVVVSQPALETLKVEACEKVEVEDQNFAEGPMQMDIDMDAAGETEVPVMIDAELASNPILNAPMLSPTQAVINPMFKLRAKDLDDQYMSESEDELCSSGKTGSKFTDTVTLDFNNVPATPTPTSARRPGGSLPSSAAKAASRAIRSVSRGSISRGSKHGFTPLAAQLSDWKASSPSKGAPTAPTSPNTTEEDLSLVSDESSPRARDSPSAPHYFADEMKIRADMEMEAMLEADLAAGYGGDDSLIFDDLMDCDITSEDVELANEANEMSLMDDGEVEAKIANTSQDDAASEASQEYGDENAIPIDPALMNTTAQPMPATPVRPVMRSFHTTSKVPLKPADDSPPAQNQQYSFSASKAANNRPVLPARNATVISYSPTKTGSTSESLREPITPGKVDEWSTIGTPARTPRRDVNTDLLRGAVVFVDVHTSEGADASAIFVELLTQMGARCVKSWPWNPSNDGNGESKIGITHVVYKDGGKRTMEKVRQSNGVVQCVGVGWVLECEKHNLWVEESSHYIDTSLIPRGGRNRRKSMEPKALTNVNGSLVTPMKNNAAAPREPMTAPNNRASRRSSSLWERTPSEVDEDEDAPGEADDWRPDMSSVLTPVPKTPAPEAIRRFAMDVTPGISSSEDEEEEESSITEKQLGMQTCPPKQSTMYALGDDILGRKKDETVMMRLMAARRKSLQFAPKVASPLSKAWY